MARHRGLYGRLFLTTFKLSACTFGGGYVIVPLMRKRFVDELHWIDEQEMLDLIALSQSSPGPIAVNASLMIGYRMAGLRGALVTALGTVLPPMLIISVLSFVYQRFRDNAYVSAVMHGMLAGVAAVIAHAVIDMGAAVAKTRDWLSTALMGAAFITVAFLRVNILWVLIACGAIGLAAGWARRRRAAGRGEGGGAA